MPRLVPAPCLRRAYARGWTARTPPPPPPSPPPTQERGEDSEETARGHGGGGGQRTDRRARGRDGRRAVETKKQKQRTKQTNAPGEESEEAGTNTATYGGRPGRHGPARDAGELPDLGGMGAPKEKIPPPHCSQVPHPVLASCLRRVCDMRATKGRRQGRPPPPPHTTAPPRVGDDGSGTRTPPRGQSGRVGRQRRAGAGRTTRPCPKGARAVQAPTGGPPGVRPQGR